MMKHWTRDFAQQPTALSTCSVITSTLDSKAVNKIPSTWLKIHVSVIKGEKRVRRGILELSWLFETEQERLETHIARVIIQKALQEMCEEFKGVLIIQTNKKHDCSSLPALPTAMKRSWRQELFQTCPDQPSFWCYLLQLALCVQTYLSYTHSTFSHWKV